MAESQLVCMEDGLMPAEVPESNPQFYYKEAHRAALEELLRHGDGAFKTLLKKENSTDFLSARELKNITNTFVKCDVVDEEEKAQNETVKKENEGKQRDSESLRSTYWPQMSDTEVPALDLGWPSSGLFKGVTQVTVHTHPPKGNGPHIKEVVRKLIQKSYKVVAIVMDLLTDIQILQDLFEASKRGVPVYIVLDVQGAPHFIDMCNRMKVGGRELKNVRTRTLTGIGLNLSFGKIPGNVHSKYMLIDGDKVMFGTYSFSWSCSRMDRNMITVMSGQVVDFYDNDFCELYAISNKLDLFKEFHLAKPQTGTLSRASVAKRPVTAYSRFQVNLGDTARGDVPAHKYHNPKYLLSLGQIPGSSTPLIDFINNLELPEPGQHGPEEQLEIPTHVPEADEPEQPKQTNKKKRWWPTFKKKQKMKNESVSEEPSPTDTDDTSKPTHATEDTTKHTEDTTKHTEDTDEHTDANSKPNSKKRFNLFKKAK
ncbi:protein FAM83F [Triplophysa dalaica]|uniref:protein FAM83F n=1 Tax=Triplophysa dalaica TaxID=1582913 RepID=UPI0024DFD27F|nr:protein FAM83F [Triplophysa dalaica]